MGLAGYKLLDLYTNIPTNARAIRDTANLDAEFVKNPNGQIMYGTGWDNMIQYIPVAIDSVVSDNLTSPGDTIYYKSYNWDYTSILHNDSLASYGIVNPYTTFFKRTTLPRQATDGSIITAQDYFTGGSLGEIEFTGKYQSTADFSVFIPFRQEVELFVPAIPVVEVSGESDFDVKTPIFCRNGGSILINGFPAASSTSIGYFVLRDSAKVDSLKATPTKLDDNNIIATIYDLSRGKVPAGFKDNENGTATLDLALIHNKYRTIRIDYTYQDNNSPAVGTGSTYIRVTPNPTADFNAFSLVPKDSVLLKSNPIKFKNVTLKTLAEGRPWRDYTKADSTLADGFCEGNWLYFVNAATFGSKNLDTIYSARRRPNWTFSGGALVDSASSREQVIAYNRYATFGKYSISFNVQSQFGCPSQIVTKPITIGAIPEPKFAMNGISVATPINVVDQSSVASDGTTVNYSVSDFKSALWYYGDTTAVGRLKVQLDSSLVLQPAFAYAKYDSTFTNHLYKTPGHYDIYIKSRTRVSDGVVKRPGCEIISSRHVIVVDTIHDNVFKNAGQYTDSFESADSLVQWQTSDSSRVTSSWTKGIANKSNIKSIPGDSVWVTGLTTPYLPAEKSYLYSSAFDITSLLRPMVSFDSWVSINQNVNLNDGVNLEFSTDTLNIADPNKIWYRLGTNSDGTNWFNRAGLASSPGDQRRFPDDFISGQFGWSKEDTDWNATLHTLSPDLPNYPGARSRVIFRFALSSIESTGDEGIAIDNFRIGERTRVILVENFSNLGTNSPDEKIESDYLKGNFGGGANIGTDFVKLVYHVGFPEQDPFNLDNPADPSGRSLYYGVSKTPYARMDGHEGSEFDQALGDSFEAWGREGFDSRTLLLSKAKIEFAPVKSNKEGSYKIKVLVTATDSLPQSTILHVVLAERGIPLASLNKNGTDRTGMVKTGETSFEYVVKKMLPSASGTKFTKALKADSTRSFPTIETDTLEWTPDKSVFYGDGITNSTGDMVAIAFLQDEITREVHQAIISPLLPDPGIITAIENPIIFEDIQIFPNPADQQLNIVFPRVLERDMPIVLVDQMGKITNNIKAFKGEKSTILETSNLASGLYILQLDLGGGKIARTKIIVGHR